MTFIPAGGGDKWFFDKNPVVMASNLRNSVYDLSTLENGCIA